MNNVDLSFHNVVSITQGDVNNGNSSGYWKELQLVMEDGTKVDISMWGKTQESVIIKHE